MRKTNSLFHIARIRLTLWYVFISLLVSVLFSALLFSGIMNELDRRIDVAERREQRNPRFSNQALPAHVFLQEDIEAIRKRLIILLLYINGFIALASGGAGYILAGKSLRPIETAMTKQRQFISDASHELRTPLTSLKVATELAIKQKGLRAADARSVLKSNLDDIDDLDNLINEIMYLARLQEVDTVVQTEIVDLSKIVRSASQKYKRIARAADIDVQHDIQKASARGNADDLKKLVAILLDNAVKYNRKKGSIHIELAGQKDTVTLTVSDTGMGMSAADRTRIFDRFYRSNKARTRQSSNGHGLGLSIAKRIVHQHHGTIAVASTKGKGTTFTVTLPAA